MADGLMKRCSKCGVEKPATPECFPKRKQCKYGVGRQCHECVRAYQVAYRAEHRAEACLCSRLWRESHPEQSRFAAARWRAANPEESRARSRASYKTHVAERLVYRAAYNATHRAERLVYRAAHPALMRVYRHRRRARTAAAGGTHTAADIALQLKTQTDKKGRLHCWICGKVIADGKYHIDHSEPLKYGGSNGAENIRITHPTCNLQKGAKSLAEFMGRLL